MYTLYRWILGIKHHHEIEFTDTEYLNRRAFSYKLTRTESFLILSEFCKLPVRCTAISYVECSWCTIKSYSTKCSI